MRRNDDEEKSDTRDRGPHRPVRDRRRASHRLVRACFGRYARGGDRGVRLPVARRDPRALEHLGRSGPHRRDHGGGGGSRRRLSGSFRPQPARTPGAAASGMVRRCPVDRRRGDHHRSRAPAGAADPAAPVSIRTHRAPGPGRHRRRGRLGACRPSRPLAPGLGRRLGGYARSRGGEPVSGLVTQHGALGRRNHRQRHHQSGLRRDPDC